MFYSWIAVSHDTGDPPVATGIMPAGDPGPAQRAAGAFLLSGRAFLAMVQECWPGGQVWDGRRTISGSVSWRPRRPC